MGFHALHAGNIAPAIRPIVDHEKNKGIFEGPQLFETTGQLSDILINVVNHGKNTSSFIQVRIFRKWVPMLLWKLVIGQILRAIEVIFGLRHIVERAVWSVGRKIDKERSIARLGLLHEAQCMIKVKIGAVTLH